MLELPNSKKSIDQNKYPFKIDDQEYWLTRSNYITGRQVQEIEKLTARSEILVAVAPDERTREAMLDLPMEHLKELYEDWQKDGKISVGESSSSDD